MIIAEKESTSEAVLQVDSFIRGYVNIKKFGHAQKISDEYDLRREPLKVAQHSFQLPMPNTPLIWNYLCFGARFLQEPSLTTV